MAFARYTLLLIAVAGILLCPYSCMGMACAHAKGKPQASAGCHCQKCQQNRDQSAPADNSPNDEECCDCVCDGAVAKTADDDLMPVVLSPSMKRIVGDSSVIVHVQPVLNAVSPSHYESGKCARIALRSLVI